MGIFLFAVTHCTIKGLISHSIISFQAATPSQAAPGSGYFQDAT
jgi:hypothetical protein